MYIKRKGIIGILIGLAAIFLVICLIDKKGQEPEKKEEINQKQLRNISQRYEAHLIHSIEDTNVSIFQEKLEKDGRFSDIHYRKKGENPRETVVHLQRLETMARVYQSKKQSNTQTEKLKNDLFKGMAFWNSHHVTAGNWWWNRLRIPMIMSNVLFLMEDELPGALKKDSIKVLNGYIHSQAPELQGLNLVEAERINFINGIIRDDRQMINRAVSSIQKSLKVSEIGIQPDMTFHQHDQSIQTGTYGIRYALEVAVMFSLTHGTSYSFSSSDYKLLSHFILDGIQWFISAQTIDYTTLGRGITRKDNELENVITMAEIMEKLPTDRENDFRRFIERMKGDRPSFVGNRAYDESGLMVHHQKNYYSSVRILPNDMKSSEPYYNGEGMNNRHMADGANLFYLKGNGYAGIFPVWDWRKIPGTTVVHTDKKKKPVSGENNMTFTISDGKYGLASMKMNYDELSAKKAWFFFHETIVALGTGIQSDSQHPVVTTIDQRIWKDDVTTSETPLLTQPVHKRISKPSWVYQDGIGYIFPGRNDSIHLLLNEREASWRKINKRYGRKAKVEEKVFELWVNHGKKPEQSSYQYIVVPGADQEKFRKIKDDLPIEILENSSTIQAVKNKKLEYIQAVFWKGARLALPGGMQISTNQPAVLLMHKKKGQLQIKASASNHSKKTLKIIIVKEQKNRKQQPIKLQGTQGVIDNSI